MCVSTDSRSNRSLIRSHPVSGSSGRLLEEDEEVEVEEEEEAPSAAWTLGSRRQNGGGLAIRRRLWRGPCSRPVLHAPSGTESAPCLRAAKAGLGCSGGIVLHWASGCGREATTHGDRVGMLQSA